jgi:4a-hydroxytetrahydrobiopterin dehydratase
MALTQKTCKPCEGGMPPLGPDQIALFLAETAGWEVDAGKKEIRKLFAFDSYWAGLGFVNAVAWIAQREKHHPDIELGYKKVLVKYSTHAVGGLSENDFICAAKINALQN